MIITSISSQSDSYTSGPFLSCLWPSTCCRDIFHRWLQHCPCKTSMKGNVSRSSKAYSQINSLTGIRNVSCSTTKRCFVSFEVSLGVTPASSCSVSLYNFTWSECLTRFFFFFFLNWSLCLLDPPFSRLISFSNGVSVNVCLHSKCVWSSCPPCFHPFRCDQLCGWPLH